MARRAASSPGPEKSPRAFRTQKEAQACLDDVVPKVKAGVYTEPSKQPLVRFLQDEWLPAISASVRPLTRDRYARVIALYIAKRDIGGIPLCSLSGGHLSRLYAELDEAGLPVATRRLVHAVLRHALNDAIRWQRLPRNPATAADPPALSRSRAHSRSARELGNFLAQVQGDRLFALWRLAATTGMRRGEVAGLTWQALDIDAARLRVEQQLLPTPGGLTFGASKVPALGAHHRTRCGHGPGAAPAPPGAAA